MKPEFAIIEEYRNKNLRRDGYTKALLVDTRKAKYQGTSWLRLDNYKRRKFENLLILSNTAIDRGEKIKVLYN